MNLILIYTRELSRVLSTRKSTLYTSGVWSMCTLHLVYPKYYELYIYKYHYMIYDITFLIYYMIL